MIPGGIFPTQTLKVNVKKLLKKQQMKLFKTPVMKVLENATMNAITITVKTLVEVVKGLVKIAYNRGFMKKPEHNLYQGNH